MQSANEECVHDVEFGWPALFNLSIAVGDHGLNVPNMVALDNGRGRELSQSYKGAPTRD